MSRPTNYLSIMPIADSGVHVGTPMEHAVQLMAMRYRTGSAEDIHNYVLNMSPTDAFVSVVAIKALQDDLEMLLSILLRICNIHVASAIARGESQEVFVDSIDEELRRKFSI